MAVGSVLTFFILSCVISVTIQQDCCPVNYSLHVVSNTQAICIRMSATPLTFDNALSSCETTPGASLLKLHPYQDVQQVLNGANSQYWIGLRRNSNSNDDVFRWTFDGTRLTLARWDQNQPTPGSDCVTVIINLTWAAVSCASTLNYVCQVDVNCEVPSCASTVGEARCPCPAGFVKVNEQCQDINECEELSMPCNNADMNIRCSNTQGSYNCYCNAGFSQVSPGSMCSANQECAVDSDCTGNNQICRTSYDNVRRCQCASGYTSAGTACVDINECDCSAEFADCINVCENEPCEMRKCAGDNEVCANLEGNFACNCASGYVRNERNFCVDVDECAEGRCSGNRQTCTNTLGSFQCVCDVGYLLEGSVCVESCIGRCNNETEDCQESDFSCVCKNGYFRQDAGNCQDTDECGDPAACTSLSSTAVCSNTPGSFICQCTGGFQLAVDQCVDINECAEGMHNCQSTEDCVNTEGSFTCTCGENERFENGNCIALRIFRVRIIATELNNTSPSDSSTTTTLFSAHFCKVVAHLDKKWSRVTIILVLVAACDHYTLTILDILEREFPGIPEDCNGIRFDGSVTGYLRVRMASSSLSAAIIESRLERNIVTDISGDLRIRSDDILTTITIADSASSIDVVDFATTPCNPSPCLNNAPCIPDPEVVESGCLCPSGFSGEFCGNGGIVVITQRPTMAVTESSNNTVDTAVIIIIVAIVVILFVALLCCCCVCCYFLSNMQNSYGAPGHAPGFGGPAVAGPGVAPIRGPPSLSGFGRGGYYEANSVI